MLVYAVFSGLIGISLALSDVTDKVFSGDNIGTIAAFGDFNADKHVDIFTVSDDGLSVYVYLAKLESQFTGVKLLDNTTLEQKVSSIVPADFDGDLQMDLLVTTGSPNKGPVAMKIFWGDVSKPGLDTKNPLILKPVRDQPLLLDENGDMIPDLLVEKAQGERFYWLFSKHRNYTEKQQLSGGKAGTHPAMRTPQSSAFVDLNNDLTADLCIVSTADDKVQLELWLNQEGVLTKQGDPLKVEYESQAPKVVGQFTFVDIDGDLNTDIVVPVCMDAECTDSLILLYFNDKWIKLPIGLDNSGMKWGFIPPGSTDAPGDLQLPMTLRLGDFNMDGYPDLLTVLGNATGNLHRAVILENVGCGGGCGGFSRTFAVKWGTWLEDHHHRAVVPAFYDLFDDGILDILVSSVDNTGKTSVTVTQQKFAEDACFMKVTVVSGLCNYDCPGGRKPYGVNQHGPVIRYETTDLHGDERHRTITQLTQSAYFPLQLPYNIFGLGQTPNFVDKLEVGIPTNTSKPLHKTWTSVIPNSQLVIVPYPINDPSRWTNKLFVTPSRLMLLTGASLLGTCGFIAGIVAILHWRDKVEDKKEKRQESQRFHFDAM